MPNRGGAAAVSRSLLACCLALAAVADDDEPSATPWVKGSVALDVSARLPVFWGIVALHAAGVVFVGLLLCFWAHGKPAALPLVLLGAAWFTALDWAAPVANLSLVDAGWLYSIVAPPGGLPECGELAECLGLDAARASGAGVLVCAVALCAPPAEYLAAIGDCRLPYGVTPTEAEQSREMYVRLQAGDGVAGGAGAVVKTRLAKSATSNFNWDWPATTLESLLETKQALVRVLNGAQAIGWTPSQRQSQYLKLRQKQEQIDAVREQRLADVDSHCVVLPTRPMRVRADAMNFDRWGADEHLGQVTLPSLQAWTSAANCGNFGQRGTVVLSGNGYTVATCQAACEGTIGCHTFYHGVDSGDEPGSCVLQVGNTGWACLLLPSYRDYLAYTVGTVGSAPMFDEWLNLAAAGAGSNATTRCTHTPCVRLTVYDDLWAQFNLYDADASGGIDGVELQHMLATFPAMNFYSNDDGVLHTQEEMSAAEAELLASTAKLLMEEHDADGAGGVDLSEFESLWAERTEVQNPAYLGNHPLRMGDAWLTVCVGFGALVAGLLFGGWGNPEAD